MSIKNMQPEDDLNFEMGAAFGEIYTLIAPPAHTPWLKEIDFNCFYSDLGVFVARVTTRSDGQFAENWDAPEHQMEARKYSLEEWQALGFSCARIHFSLHEWPGQGHGCIPGQRHRVRKDSWSGC